MTKIPQGEWDAIAARYANGETMAQIAQRYGCTPPAIHYVLKRHRRQPTAEPRSAMPRETTAAPPATAGLDDDLAARAEAAIAAFRGHFDIARTEGSAAAHENLRRAAAELMRVAARVTIVLDRAGAALQHAAAGPREYPRSAFAAGEPAFRPRVPR
jgi:transposase-like protein